MQQIQNSQVNKGYGDEEGHEAMDADIMPEIDIAENEIDVTTTATNGFNTVENITAENVPDEDVIPENISAGNNSAPMDGHQNNILEDTTSRLLNGQ